MNDKIYHDELKDYYLYCDFLRVLATFSVMILHIAVQDRLYADIGSLRWYIANVWRNLVCWAVPVFFMISGTLFLKKRKSLKELFSKNILRLIIAYVFWSTIYALAEGGNVETIISNIIRGAYHMWFIPAIVGVYICIPIIQKIAESKEVFKYYLKVAFVFFFLLPNILQILSDLGLGFENIFINATNDLLNNIHLFNMMDYVVYFALGYYLSTEKITKRNRVVIYLVGLISLFATIILNTNTIYMYNYQGVFSVNVLFTSIAIFIGIRHFDTRVNRYKKLLQKMSKCSFGAYLLHIAVLGSLESRLDITTLDFSPIIAIPLMGIIVFVIAMMLSFVMNHIPIIKKYIV